MNPPLSRTVDPPPLFEQTGGAPLIKPFYSNNGIDEEITAGFLCFVEKLLWSFLPKDFLKTMKDHDDPLVINQAIISLFEQLPLVNWNDPQSTPATLSVTVLCPSEYTSGVGRYLCDTLSRWLVPGKFLNISSVRSLSFQFTKCADRAVFLQQVLIDIIDEKELMVIQNIRDQVEKEIRLNIYRFAMHAISLRQKNSLQSRKKR